jgi:hypothetical protein
MVLFMVLLSSEKGARDPRAMDPVGPVHTRSVNVINVVLTLRFRAQKTVLWSTGFRYFAPALQRP